MIVPKKELKTNQDPSAVEPHTKNITSPIRYLFILKVNREFIAEMRKTWK